MMLNISSFVTSSCMAESECRLPVGVHVVVQVGLATLSGPPVERPDRPRQKNWLLDQVPAAVLGQLVVGTNEPVDVPEIVVKVKSLV